MRIKKFFPEAICWILLLYFFYEGIDKVIYIREYGGWVNAAPFLKPVAAPLTFIVPVSELLLSVLLLIPARRVVALYLTIGLLLIYVFWIMGIVLFTHYVFSPFHFWGSKPSWFSKLVVSMGFSWLAFIGLSIIKGWFSFKRFSSEGPGNKVFS